MKTPSLFQAGAAAAIALAVGAHASTTPKDYPVNKRLVARHAQATHSMIARSNAHAEHIESADVDDATNHVTFAMGGPMLGAMIGQLGMPFETAKDIDNLNHAICEKTNEMHLHTYQGFQGMQWPASVIESTAHLHPGVPDDAVSDRRVLATAEKKPASSRVATNNDESVGSAPPKTQNPSGDNSTTMEDGVDYSMSPAYLPAINTTGKGDWADAVRRGKEYVQHWTIEELVNLTTGVGWQKGEKPRCVGNVAPNPRLGFPGLCLEDSPTGVRFADLVTVFPSGLTTAATFSSSLAYKRGKAMGGEFRAKGVNIALGPGMNMHRTPAGGRNWEMGGADPYLSGEAAYHTIRGMQSEGVQACAKHLIGNEQEINRNTYSSNIDLRTLHEVYLHPFLRSVQANVATIMCSYNLNNNSWSCQNSQILNKHLKTEMGFSGPVISDWGAQHSGVASANAGLDLSMPGDIDCCDEKITASFWRSNLTMAIKNGSVPEWRVRDMGARILAAWYLLGQDNQHYTKPNFDAFDFFFGKHIDARKPETAALVREIGAAGTVLLKNKNNTLPLNKHMRKLAVIGQDAGPSFRGANEFADRGGVDGVVGIGWGSGTAEFSTLVSPYEALQARARKYNTGFYWNFDNFALGRAGSIADERLGVDAAVVFVHADSGEGYITYDGNAGDRNNLTLWANGVELIKNVTMAQSNTIVVINAPGQIDLEPFIHNPNVTAVVLSHFGGSEAGEAIADVLYGDVNPSGRLPYTIAKNRSDYGADVAYFTKKKTNTSQLFYNEGLNIDYRHFDANNIEPRFAFGYGLSYTKFKYSNLKGEYLKDGKENWNKRGWSWPIPSWMFEDIYEISFDIENTGGKDGHEVPQVYLGFAKSAGEPPKVLRKFDRYALKAGEKKTVTYKLNRYDLSTWSSSEDRWIKPSGRVAIYVGASSRDIRLTKKHM